MMAPTAFCEGGHEGEVGTSYGAVWSYGEVGTSYGEVGVVWGSRHVVWGRRTALQYPEQFAACCATCIASTDTRCMVRNGQGSHARHVRAAKCDFL